MPQTQNKTPAPISKPQSPAPQTPPPYHRPFPPPAHCQSSQQLVAQRLSLSHSAQAAVGHLLRIKLHSLWREVEALLHGRGQLTDAAALLTCSTDRCSTTSRWENSMQTSYKDAVSLQVRQPFSLVTPAPTHPKHTHMAHICNINEAWKQPGKAASPFRPGCTALVMS